MSANDLTGTELVMHGLYRTLAARGQRPAPGRPAPVLAPHEHEARRSIEDRSRILELSRALGQTLEWAHRFAEAGAAERRTMIIEAEEGRGRPW